MTWKIRRRWVDDTKMNVTKISMWNELIRFRICCTGRLFWTWKWSLIPCYACLSVRSTLLHVVWGYGRTLQPHAFRIRGEIWSSGHPCVAQATTWTLVSLWLFLLLAVAGCRPDERKSWFNKKKHEDPPSVPAPNSFCSLVRTSSLEHEPDASPGRRTSPVTAATRRPPQHAGTFHKSPRWITRPI
jgi:hypothetical protein